MDPDVTDPQVINAAAAFANSQANRVYSESKARNESEDVALQRAKFAWQQEMDKAGLTGMYQGNWTMPVQQWQAETFGTWGAPTSGQQTQSAQQQAYSQAYQNALAYGQYYAPGTAPTQGQQTQQAQQQAYAQALAASQAMGQWYAPGAGPAAGQQTMAGQAQQWGQGFAQQQETNRQTQLQQANAQAYLTLLSQLRGPADWAKYQQVLGSTPGGMRDLAAAAMGAYLPGGGATTGVQPQAVSLQTMQQQIAGGGQPGQQMGAYQRGAGLPQAQGGQMQNAYYNQPGGAAPAGNETWGTGLGLQTMQQPTGDQQLQATGNGTNLPAPNQIAPEAWKNMVPSQQQMLLGQYEAQGWDKNDVTALFNQSLPKYGANAPSGGAWRLQ